MKGNGIPITGASPIVIETLIAIWKNRIEATPYP
jgi:hypothetical protein